MLISKKELLTETGISYGQLYRWKREGLIPEEWFIKQSSFTGQETFFPKEQMLNRIRAIQDLKDKYSLEELAKLLSPEINDNGFKIEELDFVEEVNKDIIASYIKILGKDTISYLEVLVLAIISKASSELSLSDIQTENLLMGIKPYFEEMKSTEYIFRVFSKDGQYYGMIYQEKASVLLDNRFEVVKEIRINDISDEMKIKYRGKFKIQSESYTKNAKQDNTKQENKEKEAAKEKDSEDGSKQKEQSNEDFILKINNWEVRL